ncbi:hypothetical protein AXG93_1931s1010 [Marchantia polymorpha subsp. ruderalis]|uniref:Uncharacterized protein n=1 Tax=Marchantia polymorpha subsp. ruderalis TaxID=1480154 RepID=A0A176W2C2_MARPO|nr:hypothetical protein AXG93_1931s1010 [Marchantia polymorpha subsp. ruderalis]
MTEGHANGVSAFSERRNDGENARTQTPSGMRLRPYAFGDVQNGKDKLDAGFAFGDTGTEVQASAVFFVLFSSAKGASFHRRSILETKAKPNDKDGVSAEGAGAKESTAKGVPPKAFVVMRSLPFDKGVPCRMLRMSSAKAPLQGSEPKAFASACAEGPSAEDPQQGSFCQRRSPQQEASVPSKAPNLGLSPPTPRFS